MSANDDIDPPVPSVTAGGDSAPVNQSSSANVPDEADDDRSWMDKPYNSVPPKPTKTIQVRVVDSGRLAPLPYPDPLADYEEMFGPIDVHSLNVAPGEEAFSFIAKFYDDGEMEPLPYPDPLDGRDEGDDD